MSKIIYSPILSVPKRPALAEAVTNFVADEAQDTGTVGTISKISRASLKISLAGGSLPEAPTSHVISHLSTLSDTFKTLGIFKNIREIVANNKKGLPETEKPLRTVKTTKAATGIIVNGMAGCKVLDNLELIKLGNISKKLGITASTIGEAAATAFSFSSFLSYIETIEGIFGIAISSITLKGLNKKIKDAKTKEELWENCDLNNLGAIAAAKIKGQKPEVDKFHKEYLQAKRNYKKIAREEPKKFIEKCKWKRQLKTAEKGLNEAGSAFKKAIKIDLWGKIAEKAQNNTLTKQDNLDLEELISDKCQKWKTKIKNITLDKVREGFSLGITLFVILASISIVVLNILVPPGALLAVAVLSLMISIAGAARQYLPKILKCCQKSHETVEIPELS